MCKHTGLTLVTIGVGGLRTRGYAGPAYPRRFPGRPSCGGALTYGEIRSATLGSVPGVGRATEQPAALSERPGMC